MKASLDDKGNPMSEQNDVYSLYEAGTFELLNRIGRDHQLYENALLYQLRLSENIKNSRLYGETDILKADRNRIINELNKLALSALGVSFNEILAQVELKSEQETDEILLNIVSDPVSLVELRSEGPVWSILKQIAEARMLSRWKEVLRLYKQAVKCESRYHDPSARAIAKLFKADALIRSGCFKEGTEMARRASTSFAVQTDHRNKMLADLLLAFPKLKTGEDLDDLRLDYMAIYEELKSKVTEGRQGYEEQFYRQSMNGIQRALDHINQSLAREVDQSCCLNTIPILQLLDGPDRVFQSSKMISYFTTDEFKIEERRYLLHSLDKSTMSALELNADVVHFALPVPADGWPTPASKKERDFVLVRAQAQEGVGFFWTGQKWATGRFKRDTTTGTVSFLKSEPHIIGKQVDIEVIEVEKDITSGKYGYVVGLLQPVGSTELPLGD